MGASYYDSSLRWFENDGKGVFTEHLISTGVNEGQGVILADLDSKFVLCNSYIILLMKVIKRVRTCQSNILYFSSDR